MKYFVFILIIVFSWKAFSQKNSDKDTIPVFYVAEEMPEFPGGKETLQKWISNEIYSAKTDSNCIITKIFISFVIDTTGKVICPEVVYKNPFSFSCNEFESYCRNSKSELAGMPAWKPGKQKGKKVRVKYNIPVNIDWQ